MKLTTHQVVVAGLLGALAVVLGLTPLGFIPVPTPAGAATTEHIPVIIGAVLEGPLVGAFVGLIFGLISFLRATLPFFRDPLIAIGPRVLIGITSYLAYRFSRHRVARPVAAALAGVAVGRGVWDGLGLVATSFRQGHLATGFGHLVGSWAVLAGPHALAGWLAGVLAALLAWWVLRPAEAPVAIAAMVGSLTNTVGVLGLIVWRFHWPLAVAVLVGVTNGLPEMLLAAVVTTAVVRAARAALPRYREGA